MILDILFICAKIYVCLSGGAVLWQTALYLEKARKSL